MFKRKCNRCEKYDQLLLDNVALKNDLDDLREHLKDFSNTMSTLGQRNMGLLDHITNLEGERVQSRERIAILVACLLKQNDAIFCNCGLDSSGMDEILRGPFGLKCGRCKRPIDDLSKFVRHNE